MDGLEIKQTMSSREIAELTGKRHKNVLVDCDFLNENYKKMGLAEISAGVYIHPKTGSQQHREYLLSKMQTMDLMTGYNIELRIKVNRRWEELENKNNQLDFSNPDTVLMLAQNWKQERQKRIEAEQQMKKDAPKILFANAVCASKNSILIGELAKILNQNGIDIGQNRFFIWLRKNGFLISRKGTDYNMPTQKSMDLSLFEIKETVVTHSDGHISVSKTPKVTGKGQEYFINKFLKHELA